MAARSCVIPMAAMMSVPVSESDVVARGESLINVDFAKWYFTVFSRFMLLLLPTDKCEQSFEECGSPPAPFPGGDRCGGAASACEAIRSFLVSSCHLLFQFFEFCAVLIADLDVVVAFPFR
ncbi:hypothetical protein D3C85_1450770 [compost metagenome]